MHTGQALRQSRGAEHGVWHAPAAVQHVDVLLARARGALPFGHRPGGVCGVLGEPPPALGVGRPREWNWGGPKAKKAKTWEHSWTAFWANNIDQISVAGICSKGHDEFVVIANLYIMMHQL
jgi:hypothetical protein